MTVIKQEADVKTQAGKNFSAVHAGPLSALDNYKLEIPAQNRTVRGKLFIKEFLAMTGMQISVNKLPAGGGVPFLHKHKENEEVYLFVKGRGQMQVDGEVFEVEEGSIVRVSTDGFRSIRNNSNAELQYICIQAKENSLTQHTFDDGVRAPEEVTWPD